MKYLFFCLAILYSAFSYSQKLELINVDNVKNISLGQGVQLELMIKIDDFQVDTSKCELVSNPKLTSKFIVIPKDTGRHKIGPIICGDLVSNTIVIDVVPVTIDSDVYIIMPDSAKVGDRVKLLVTNVSKSEGYTIKNLEMKSSHNYKVIGKSFSMSVTTKGGTQVKKETLTITIEILKIGEILINTDSFSGVNKGFTLQEKTLVIDQ